MKNIILIAPPGAGKGTVAKMLVDRLDMIHISIGDLLREEVNSQSDLGKSLSIKMQSGNLVEDDLIFKILNKKLNIIDKEKGIIFDGFPRNINQAINLDLKIDAVIYLNVPKEVLENRIIGRVICSKCGLGYNTNFVEMMPKVENICDKCGSALTKRKDDTKEIFGNRYDTYMNETYPVLEYYKNKKLLYNIESLNKEEVFDEIIKIIESTGPKAY